MTRTLLRTVGDERGASTRYRVLAHRAALEAAGFRTSLRFSEATTKGGRLLELVRDLWPSEPAELLLIHRKTYPVRLASRLRHAAACRVFDMDDALDLPPPGRSLDAGDMRRYRRRFEATVNACDLVICGNRNLEARAPHKRTAILPTPIDTMRFEPGRIRPDWGAALGWVGHSDNLPYLERLAPALRKLAERHPRMRLIVVADRPPTIEGVPLEFRRWTLEREVAAFDEMSVGLMPLDDSQWARGKCAFKALQYMALGLPAVVSPVGMNAEAIEHGRHGYHALDQDAWFETLDRLLSDVAHAQALGAAGRRRVERDYSVSVTSKRLVRLLRELLAVGGASVRVDD